MSASDIAQNKGGLQPLKTQRLLARGIGASLPPVHDRSSALLCLSFRHTKQECQTIKAKQTPENKRETTNPKMIRLLMRKEGAAGVLHQAPASHQASTPSLFRPTKRLALVLLPATRPDPRLHRHAPRLSGGNGALLLLPTLGLSRPKIHSRDCRQRSAE